MRHLTADLRTRETSGPNGVLSVAQGLLRVILFRVMSHAATKMMSDPVQQEVGRRAMLKAAPPQDLQGKSTMERKTGFQ